MILIIKQKISAKPTKKRDKKGLKIKKLIKMKKLKIEMILTLEIKICQMQTEKEEENIQNILLYEQFSKTWGAISKSS